MLKTKKIFSFLLIFTFAFVSIFTFTIDYSYAASPYVDISGDDTYYIGDTVTIKVYYGGITYGSADCQIQYDNSVMEYIPDSGENNYGQISGGNGLITAGLSSATDTSTLSFSASFKTKKTGTSGISVITTSVCDSQFNVYSLGTVYSSVSVIEYPKSGDCNLDSISLSTGVLNPTFASSITYYETTVEYSVSEVNVYYEQSDSSASVSLSGSKTLEVGENVRTLTVTAENGSQKTYTVKLIRAAENGDLPDGTNYYELKKESALSVTIDGVEYSVLDDLTGINIPDGFLEETKKYNEYDIPMIYGKHTNMHLGYLVTKEKLKELEESSSDESTDTETTTETENDTTSTYTDIGTWFFFNESTQSFSSTYALTSEELKTYANYLINGDEEPEIEPVEPEKKSIFEDDLLIFVILGTLAILFIVILILQINIIKNRKPKEKKKKDKEESLDKESIEENNDVLEETEVKIEETPLEESVSITEEVGKLATTEVKEEIKKEEITSDEEDNPPIGKDELDDIVERLLEKK